MSEEISMEASEVFEEKDAVSVPKESPKRTPKSNPNGNRAQWP